jgi:hypothetical protein
MFFCVACQGGVIDGPAIRGKELRVEPSRGYVICRECYADNGYACTTFMSSRTKLARAEGVWMSVTPTDEDLIVALDFEGWTDFLWLLILTDDWVKF